jgi:hypothetical protein
MRATVDDIERRYGEDKRRLHTSQVREVLVERNTLLARSGLSDGDGDTEDSVGAEFALVGCAVELDEEIVDLLLLGDLETGFDKFGGDDVVDVCDGLGDTCNKECFSL